MGPAGQSSRAHAAALPLPGAELPVVFGEDKGKGVVVRALLVQAPGGGYEYEVRAGRLPRGAGALGKGRKPAQGGWQLRCEPKQTGACALAGSRWPWPSLLTLPPLLAQLSVSNVSAGVPLDGFMIQFNKNALGLAPTSQVVPLEPGEWWGTAPCLRGRVDRRLAACELAGRGAG